MKILLIGEYSRLHNSLKEGLKELGHQVSLKGLNDGFKNYPIDFKIQRKWNSGILKKIKNTIYKTTGLDITSYLTYQQVVQNSDQFSGFDVVQLINENSFLCQPKDEIKIIDILIKNNKKIFLLSCGEDYTNVNFNFQNPDRKSILNPYFSHKLSQNHFIGFHKFRKSSFKKLHEFISENCSGIIASDLDYHEPLLNNPKYLGLIANPINISYLKYIELNTENKIVIFLGINTQNYYKKGLDYFEKALTIIQAKYAEKVEVIIARNIPYNHYINLYNKSHILLDQVYALDQGYNALEAMAKGKVVFTGAEKEFTEYYQLKEIVAINAIPNVDYLVNKLSFLIENPNEISVISKQARAFIEKEHDYIKIAEKYLEAWNNN